ncbi:hypothetical protein [Roseobacter sp.]|uniref:hypothetical protein n=1 Tax=Roseobacter sp. TaxID=1907202 RepID=UPI0032984F43
MSRLRYIICAVLALTVLVSVITRPPGAMLTLQGDTLTYTLCTGTTTTTLTVDLDDSDNRDIDLSCDAFTVQHAMLPTTLGGFGAASVQWVALSQIIPDDHPHTTPIWSPYTSRAPPLLS